MYNYQQILRMAHKQGVKLTNGTMRKEFSMEQIKPEEFRSGVAHFSDYSVQRYIEKKKQAKRGRPKQSFSIKGVRYESEEEYMNKHECSRSTVCYWKSKQKKAGHKK